jgi:hypothetical protein
MERELIVVVKHEARLRATREGIASVEGADANPLADVLASESATALSDVMRYNIMD